MEIKVEKKSHERLCFRGIDCNAAYGRRFIANWKISSYYANSFTTVNILTSRDSQYTAKLYCWHRLYYDSKDSLVFFLHLLILWTDEMHFLSATFLTITAAMSVRKVSTSNFITTSQLWLSVFWEQVPIWCELRTGKPPLIDNCLINYLRLLKLHWRQMILLVRGHWAS